MPDPFRRHKRGPLTGLWARNPTVFSEATQRAIAEAGRDLDEMGRKADVERWGVHARQRQYANFRHQETFARSPSKRLLPRKVNHNTLKVILKYLESGNKIAVSLKGLTWIYNNENPHLREAVASTHPIT